MVTGCFKRDDLEDVTVYTTIYPIKYLGEELYGNNSTIKSIYPKGVDVSNYPISDKKIADYAKESALFIYNGNSNEKDIAAKFLKKNKGVRIIDVAQGLNVDNNKEELWISPSNYLMLALNIKNGLKEYIDNTYIHQEIENNYTDLKARILGLEAEFKTVAESSKDKPLVVMSDSLLFLKKYGFNVISIDNTNQDVEESIVNEVKKLISNKTLTAIFKLDNQNESELLRDIIVNTKVKVIDYAVSMNLKEDEDDKTINYLTIVQENIEKIKGVLYE
ncbi:MAG: zinc ABC transporter substrate-binding protein [Mollicutes bacterium]|nr:zinc ABC transporter substrate-binding protein [Mollicutes bacterium]